jgi:phosphatidate cytidylyltransferase
VASLPIFYVAVQQKPYPEDCPIGIPGWIGLGLVMACGLSGLAMLSNFRQRHPQVIECWALSSLIPLYVGGLGSYWILIRLNGTPAGGLINLVGIIAVTKITDAAAYFVGRSLGRHKLCPAISPGKTIEGAVGGLLAGVFASVGYFQGLVPWVLAETRPNSGWLGLVCLGILIGVFGIVGDLIESVVKRSVEAKDSGRLLPGLGGLWDVTDSLLPTAAIGYLGVLARWI